MTTASGAVQTAFNAHPALGLPGMQYDSADNDIITRIAATDIPFGSYVKCTAGDNCALPGASGDIEGEKGGIALLDPSKATGAGYKQGDPVSILRKGRVWMQSEGAIAELSVPFVRYTVSGGGAPVGGIGGASDSGKNAQPAAGMVCLKGTTGAGVALIDVNYPQ